MIAAALCISQSSPALGNAGFEGECGGRWLTERFPVSRGAFPDQRWWKKHLHDKEFGGSRWEQRFQVLGWSKDGTRWGYCEEGDYGQGATEDYRATLRILTAQRPRTEAMSHQEGMSSKQRASARRRFRGRALKLLAKHKLGGHFGAEALKTAKLFKRFEYSGVHLAPGLHKRPRIRFTAGDHSYMAEVRLRGKGEVDDYHSRLIVRVWRSDQKTWKTVIKDKGHPRTLSRCSIVYASLSPDNKHLALLIAGYGFGYEGHRTFRFIGAVTTLP